jgi:heme a synthase
VRLPLRSPLIASWLFGVALLIVIMMLVGGATRLTESGLSITEWKPITGVVPPGSDAAWTQEFQKYQQIPQFKAVNSHMTLTQFKGIYWWEWTHRLLGRLIGLAAVLPFIVFLLMSEVPVRMIWRGTVLCALIGLQGYIGWWMVQSGLSTLVSVAPERLATHQGLAFVILIFTIWSGLEALAGEGRARVPVDWRIATGAVLGFFFLQVMLGALVAGNDAGLVYNDWPLMNGHFAPIVDYSKGLGNALLHDQGMVQFLHRLNAYVLTAYVIVFAVVFAYNCYDETSKLISNAIGYLTAAQVVLGIATLVTSVNLNLALLHQFVGICLITLATILLWRVARADRMFR